MLKQFIQPLKRGYTEFRADFIKLISPHANHILDVGCGAGELGKAIKERNPNAHVIGLDFDKELLEIARISIDEAYHVDFNDVEVWQRIGKTPFDAIIFADVLEHLVDPKRKLIEGVKHLKDGGKVITCIPNIRHWSTYWHLIIRGQFPRNERSIFDKTHLHFVTKKNILDLLASAKLSVVEERRNVRIIEPWSWTNIPGKLFDFWPFRSFMTFQYIHVSERT